MSGEVRIAKVLNCARYSETVWECLLEPGTVLQFSSMSAAHGHAAVSTRRLLRSRPSGDGALKRHSRHQATTSKT